MPEADDGQSRKRSRSGGGKWTADEEATLSELAGRLVGTNAASGESRRAWAQIGHEMGRSAGSVQQHWEVMQGTHPSLDQYGPGRLRGAEAMKPASSSSPVAAAAVPVGVNPLKGVVAEEASAEEEEEQVVLLSPQEFVVIAEEIEDVGEAVEDGAQEVMVEEFIEEID